jgi:hypothetical protein
MPRLTETQIRRLQQAIAEKLQSREALVAESDGHLTVETYPHGDGYDVKLIIRTR